MSASANPNSILYAYLQLKSLKDEMLEIYKSKSLTSHVKLYIIGINYINYFNELEKRLQRTPFPGYEQALEDFIREQRKIEKEKTEGDSYFAN